MDRAVHLNAAKTRQGAYDFCVVGGGASGLGVAVDAAARGFSVLLVERSDFAKGTSSRSTKLVHGGVRYLKQGNISLVREALRERGLMRRNAPHLVRELEFVIPSYSLFNKCFYGVGMKMYDALAGRLGLTPSRLLSTDEVATRIPTVKRAGLKGGVAYCDGQFDDARMAVNLAQTAAELGANVLNYVACVGLLMRGGKVAGVRLEDRETKEVFEVEAKSVINATGVFVDDLRKMEEPACAPMVQPSQGVHLVLPKRFLPGCSALMEPKTADGRVLFAIPWYDSVVLGTTDTPLEKVSEEPRALAEEIEFLMTHAALYMDPCPKPDDVRSVFAGLRPLVRPPSGGKGGTAAISRDHTIAIGRGGLITLTGGKWTSYRKMAEDTVNQALKARGESAPACKTRELRVHGWTLDGIPETNLKPYGADAAAVRALNQPNQIHPAFTLTEGEVRWQVRCEMARTVEDVLFRRSHCLLFDAKKSVEAAPAVARIMAEELGKDEAWQAEQVEQYAAFASGYIFPAQSAAEAI